MNKHRRNLVFHYLMAFAIAAVIGLLYNHYKSGVPSSALAVCGFAFAAATTATACRVIATRYFSRR